MNEVVRSFAEAIEKMYRSFILRDLLGFILPGLIFLTSLWFLVGNPTQSPLCQSTTGSLHCLTQILGAKPNVWQILALVGVSYLTGWVLQSVHFGIIDWIFQIVKYHRVSSFFWPLLGGVFSYAQAITMSDNQSDTPLSLITTGALNPDQKLKSLRGAKALSRVQESAPYTERISALMLMTGNIAIAGIPLLIVIVSQSALRWWHMLIGIGILLLIYLEHWRLLYARNLRHSLAIDAAGQENERIVS